MTIRKADVYQKIYFIRNEIDKLKVNDDNIGILNSLHFAIDDIETLIDNLKILDYTKLTPIKFQCLCCNGISYKIINATEKPDAYMINQNINIKEVGK